MKTVKATTDKEFGDANVSAADAGAIAEAFAATLTPLLTNKQRILLVIGVGASNEGKYGNPTLGGSVTAATTAEQLSPSLLGCASARAHDHVVLLQFDSFAAPQAKDGPRLTCRQISARFPLAAADRALTAKLRASLDQVVSLGGSLVLMNFVTDALYHGLWALLDNGSRWTYVNQYLAKGPGVRCWVCHGSMVLDYELPRLADVGLVLPEPAKAAK